MCWGPVLLLLPMLFSSLRDTMTPTEIYAYLNTVLDENPAVSRLELDQHRIDLYTLAQQGPTSGVVDLTTRGVALSACQHNDLVSRGYDSTGALVVQFLI